jgi:hypothetical protein
MASLAPSLLGATLLFSKGNETCLFKNMQHRKKQHKKRICCHVERELVGLLGSDRLQHLHKGQHSEAEVVNNFLEDMWTLHLSAHQFQQLEPILQEMSNPEGIATGSPLIGTANPQNPDGSLLDKYLLRGDLG